VILVDSSVWIDFFRGKETTQTIRLEALLDTQELAVGDLILAEVLQGFSDEGDFTKAQFIMTTMDVVELVGEEIALQAAQNYRFLRSRGITIRKTIDTIIATKCIAEGLVLLHSNRDFEPFVTHLGLQVVV